MVDISNWLGTLSKVSGLTGKRMLVRTSDGSSTYTETGTSANDVCAGNDSRLSDARTPTSHASSHQSGGGDAIKLDDLAAADDNTDNDVSTSAHGLAPKLSNDAATWLDGTGAWSAPTASEVGAPDIVSITGNTTLVKATHQSKILVCDGEHTLTVDGSTDFDAQGACVISAEGGQVTITDTATVNTPGSDPLTIVQYGEAVLRRMTTADTYTLKGTLG